MEAAGVNKVGAGAGLKMVLKNTYEGVHLLLKFSGHGQKFVTFWESQKKAVIRIIYKSQQMMLAGQNFSM